LNQLAENIARDIKSRGTMSFTRFMELALYCPVYGYYETEEDKTGRRGDFVTSVSVGRLFGELLAFQFADWLEEGQRVHRAAPEKGTNQPPRVQILEAGANDGQLAKDILTWLRERRTPLFERIEYVIAEPSSRLKERQRATLREFGPGVRWVSGLAGAGAGEERVCGIIFSNELLDAMPVYRYGWDAKRAEWFEWGVTVDGDRFKWARMGDKLPSQMLRARLPAELCRVLPDGFTIEECPAAHEWWRRAAQALRWGKLVTLDYGLVAEERLMPEREHGTLRAYRGHRLSDDLLADPGSQDLTAHVDFTAIQDIGERAGLKTEALTRQEEFLTRIAVATWADEPRFGAWSLEQRRQFQTLTHPERFGRFRVLVQGRD
jgi:SAM-dependent MidA family methyltransferase